MGGILPDDITPDSTHAYVYQNPRAAAAVVRVPGLRDTGDPSFAGLHPSLTATATALAVGVVAEEIAPDALGVAQPAACIAVVTRSRFGDVSVIRIEAP